MTIKAIFWDIGGVLVRTEDRSARQALAKRHQMSYEQMEALFFGGESGRRAQCGEISADEQIAFVCRTLGLPTDPVSRQAFEREFFAGDRLDQNLLDEIQKLHQRYQTGIISNALDHTRAIATEQWGFGAIFDAMVFSAEVGFMKPDRRIFEVALSQLAVPANSSLFIDDFMHNVEGARAVGMRAILFKNPKQVLQDVADVLEEE
jgi:putative hydrolase of the HAD superfamily